MTQAYQSYNHWRMDLDAEDDELWSYIQRLECGHEGHFGQKLWSAMNHADGSNARRLYEAFPDYFNPPEYE